MYPTDTNLFDICPFVRGESVSIQITLLQDFLLPVFILFVVGPDIFFHSLKK